MLATTLVFSLGTGAAFANDDETQATETTIEQVEIVTEDTTTTSEDTTTGVAVDETTTEEVTEPTTEEPVTGEETDTEEVTTDEESTESTESTDVTEEEETAAPSLVPGDFFYFVKVMTEKIRLAFTFDDYKEAQLLADFAAERIAEANALIADGKSEEAAELLKEAIATQQQADEVLPESEAVTTEPDGEETEEVATETEGEATDSATPDSDSEATEVEKKLAHNVDALMAVLAKVENPKAQQAIMKNIEKTFVKLDKKFTRLEEKQAKQAEKKNKIEEGTSEDVLTEVISQPENESSTNQVTTTTEVGEVNKAAELEATVAAEKAVAKQQEALRKAEEMKQVAAQKAEEMKQEAARKAEAKQQEAAGKAEAKQQQAAQKAQGKQNAANGKAEGKGNN